MPLTPNTAPLRVDTSTGGQLARTYFGPNELMYDANRVVRLISRFFEDGLLGNYLLLPRSLTAIEVIKTACQWLRPLGLDFAGGRIVKGDEVVPSLVQWLVSTSASPDWWARCIGSVRALVCTDLVEARESIPVAGCRRTTRQRCVQ
jgi:hypothetical protein